MCIILGLCVEKQSDKPTVTGLSPLDHWWKLRFAAAMFRWFMFYQFDHSVSFFLFQTLLFSLTYISA